MNKVTLFHAYQRRYFDASSVKDMQDVRHYFHYNRWGENGCPFFLEWPYLTVPDMIRDKITKYTLKAA
jgi:hypothetical protein